MKDLLHKGLVFAGITAGLYVLLFWLMVQADLHGVPLVNRTGDYYHWKGGAAYAQYKDFDPAEHFDVLVVGSSHAYRGYDPRAFAARGHRLFNLGSSAQTAMNSYWLLKTYADSARAPLVIFDLHESAFNNSGLESTSELTRHVPKNSTALGMAWDLQDPRGLNLMTLRLLTQGDPPLYTDSTYVDDGYAERTDSANTTIRYERGKPLRVDALQWDRFIDCLGLCAKRGVRLVFVSHFYPEQSDKARHALFHARVDSVARACGLHYFDFAYGHGASDQDHFYDHNHLNAAGARLFNQRLLDSLEQHGYLPKQRD